MNGGAGNPDLLVVGDADQLYIRTAAHPAPLVASAKLFSGYGDQVAKMAKRTGLSVDQTPPERVQGRCRREPRARTSDSPR